MGLERLLFFTMESNFISLIVLITAASPGIHSCGFTSNFKPYNSTESICCNYKLAPRFFKGSEQRCCGDLVLYLYPSQKCCGTQVRNVSELESGEYECCGAEYIRKAGNEFCCDNRSYKPGEFEKTPDTKCCGRKPYHENQSMCCKGEIRTRNSRNSDCCGTEVYDIKSQDCNDKYEILRKLPDFFHWCGEMEFDNRTRVCCKDNIVDKPKEYGAGETPPCCGNAVLNEKQKNHACSRGKVVPKGHVWCRTGPVHPVKGRCCDGVIYEEVQPSAVCCGRNLINITKKEKCCNDKIGYDPNNKQCCGDSIIDIADHCCGRQTYDTTYQVCCKDRFRNDRLVNKTNSKQDQCCGVRLYDRITEDCSGGRVRKKVNKKDHRCRGFIYEGAKVKGFTCCYNTTYNIRRQGCCGKMVYNLGRQECWGGKVIDKESPNDRGTMKKIVCLPKTNWTEISQVNIDCKSTQGTVGDLCTSDSSSLEYNPRTHVCCGGQLSLRPLDEDTVCCGTTAINGRTTLCCDDNVHDLLPNITCCGETVINVSTHDCLNERPQERLKHNGMAKQSCRGQENNAKNGLCCDGLLYQYHQNKSCCGNRTYDTETEQCMNNNVSQKRTCGTEEFEPSTHICCYGQKFPKKKNRQCCGNDIYDPRVQTCQNGTKRHKFNRFCGSVRYDLRSHVCCGSDVYRLDSQSMCCDNTMISKETDVCCDGISYPRINGFQCCRQHFYNEFDSFCDEGVVKMLDPIPEMYASCCGDVSIDTRKQVCCSSPNVLFEYPVDKLHEDHDRCCLGVPYSSMYQICTKKGLRTRNGVCGQGRYDENVDLCCDDIIYNGAKERGLICCYANSTFGTDQLCCPGIDAKPISNNGSENARSNGTSSVDNLPLTNTRSPALNHDESGLPLRSCPEPCSWSGIDQVLSKYGCQMEAFVVKKSSLRRGEATRKGVFNMRTDLINSPESWQNVQTSWKLKNSCKCFFRRKTLIFISRDKVLSEFDVIENTEINRQRLKSFKMSC